MAEQPDQDEIVTAYTAGADAAPPAYPGQPRSVRADQLPRVAGTPKSSGWMLASLVCACVGFVIPVIPSIFGLGFGVLAVTKSPRGARKQPVIVLGLSLVSLFVGPLLIYPRGDRIRENNARQGCAIHMQTVGQALIQYSIAHNGHFPDDLLPLFAETPPRLTVDDLNCPGSGDTPAQPSSNPQDQMGHLSWVYCGKGMTLSPGQPNSATAQTILMFERSGHHEGGENFLWGDGHISWEDEGHAHYLVREIQTGHNPPRPSNGQ